MSLAITLILAASPASTAQPISAAPRPPVSAVGSAVARASVEVVRAERIGEMGNPEATYRRHRPEAGGTLVVFD